VSVFSSNMQPHWWWRCRCLSRLYFRFLFCCWLLFVTHCLFAGLYLT